MSLWETLSHAKLVEGKAPELELESPWYIKFLLSVSGWFGALFFTIAFGSLMVLTLKINVEDFPSILTLTGTGIIYLVYQKFQEKQSSFLEHFLLSFSMVGQVLIIASIAIMFDDYSAKGIYFFVALFQTFLMWVIPNYIHRMMSSFFMALAWSSLFYSLDVSALYVAILTFIVAWLWMNEFYFEELKKIQAIAYGQLFALVWLKISIIYTYDILSFYSDSTHEISPMLIEFLSIFTLGYVTWKILKQYNKLDDKNLLFFSLIVVVLLGLFSLKVSGLVTGIMLLLIGFSSSHRLLMGLGVVFSLFFISHYYYFMGETLLDKAMVLALVGILLLSARWSVKNFMFKERLDV